MPGICEMGRRRRRKANRSKISFKKGHLLLLHHIIDKPVVSPGLKVDEKSKRHQKNLQNALIVWGQG
jgi:hypothetical protein